jgi:protein SCO1/2
MKNRNGAAAKPVRRKMILAVMTLAALVLAASTLVVSRAPSARGVEERCYELTGVVKSVDRAKRRAVIEHEKVGGYMEAMTMPFAIKDAKALREMRPGHRIKATLVVTDDGGMWLENITITTSAAAEAAEHTFVACVLKGDGRRGLRPVRKRPSARS